MKLRAILVGVAISFVAAPIGYAAQLAVSIQPAGPQQVSLRSWSELPQRERQMLIVAALEGLVIARTDPTGQVPVFETQCLLQFTPAEIEAALMQLVPDFPEVSFLEIYFGASGCAQPKTEALP